MKIGPWPLLALLAFGSATARETPAPRDAVATTATPAQRWQADTVALAAADSNAARRDALHARIAQMELPVRPVPFESEGGSGINLLADVSGDAKLPLLLIGAHYDRVDVGRGATDNASGTATVLALAERFKRAPLTRHRVAIAFWDLEEKGLLGAAAYVATGPKPALYVNFDVFGWGDTLWMMSPQATSPLVEASRTASGKHGLQFVSGEQYPPTDHRAFLEAKWPAVSYSLMDRDEIEPVLQMFAGKTPVRMPKVMTVIHSANDTVARLDADAAAKGVDALELALRAWDAADGGS